MTDLSFRLKGEISMKISTLFGTRPETIKLAPFIKAGRDSGHEVDVIFTGQHRSMALPLLEFFGITPTVDMNIMKPNQNLINMTSRMLDILNEDESLKNTDAVMVQGDTSSAFIGAYWAFMNKIPVIHLEAGLRTNNIHSPFPEEANRQLISRIAKIHLAPTEDAMKALSLEGICRNAFMVGNTGLDALRLVSENVTRKNMPEAISDFISNKKVVLVTSHRRENFGDGMRQISSALKILANRNPDVRFVFPVHLNPNVREVMLQELSGITNIMLTDPLDYLPFVSLMKIANVILTDSGGIQEEAPTLRVPVVVMRESTERPEGVDKGFSILVGTNPDRIVAAVSHALEHGCQGIGLNPYGDGFSSTKIWNIISQSGVIK